jgi:hypothetical protein
MDLQQLLQIEELKSFLRQRLFSLLLMLPIDDGDDDVNTILSSAREEMNKKKLF